MSLQERWDELPRAGKVAVGGGVLVGGFFAYRLFKGGSSATGTSSTLTGQGTDTSTAWGLPPGPAPLTINVSYPQNTGTDPTSSAPTPGPTGSGNVGGQPGTGPTDPPVTTVPGSTPSAPSTPIVPIVPVGATTGPTVVTPVVPSLIPPEPVIVAPGDTLTPIGNGSYPTPPAPETGHFSGRLGGTVVDLGATSVGPPESVRNSRLESAPL